MGKYLIDESTLSGIADAIRERSGKIQKELIIGETTETYSTWGGGLGQIWNILDEVSLLKFGDTCIVTLDNIKYVTTVFDNGGGYYNLGNGSLSGWGETSEEHINDMPFLVEYSPQDTGSGWDWVHEFSVTYTDNNEHTIKVEKLIGAIEPIPVNNYALEIQNMPNKKYDNKTCKVTVNYNVPLCSGHYGSQWNSLDFNGFQVKDGIMQSFGHTIDLPQLGGVQGSIEFIIPFDTILNIYANGMNWMDAPCCDIISTQVKFTYGDDNFHDASFTYSRPYPEEVGIAFPTLLGGAGAEYTEAIINIECTQYEG